MVLSHEKVTGNLTGPLLLYKSQQDKIDGTQGEKTLDTSSWQAQQLVTKIGMLLT